MNGWNKNVLENMGCWQKESETEKMAALKYHQVN